MEQQISNKEILEKLNQIQLDINILKEKLDELDENCELTDWAKQELEEARGRKYKIPHGEVKKMILEK